MFGNLGPMEMIFIFVVLLLVFGGKKLPEVGAGLGKGIREFKRSMNDIKSEIDTPVHNQQPPQNYQNQIHQPPRAQVAPPPPATPTVVGDEVIRRDA